MVKSADPADAAFANEALGPTRFDLVASGKLKLSSLYYGGKLRTIKELKELIEMILFPDSDFDSWIDEDAADTYFEDPPPRRSVGRRRQQTGGIGDRVSFTSMNWT